MLDSLFPIFSGAYELPPYLKLLQPREWRAGRRIRALHATLRSAATGRGEGGLVDLLKDGGLDDAALVDALTSILLAAHWVPAAATAWALVEQARNRPGVPSNPSRQSWAGWSTRPSACGRPAGSPTGRWTTAASAVRGPCRVRSPVSSTTSPALRSVLLHRVGVQIHRGPRRHPTPPAGLELGT